MLAQCGWLPSQLIDATPKWQTERLWWRSKESMQACPLKGLVIRAFGIASALQVSVVVFCQLLILSPTKMPHESKTKQ
jgi:hypothetical protein